MGADGITMIFRLPAILLAVTVHEFMHGYTAYLYGDTTAKDQGRLSLNPIRHLDVIGTLMLIIAGFGWAKPVPVNPYRFKNPAKHMAVVGIAGPLANFVTAFILARFYYFDITGFFGILLGQMIGINIMLGIFNLLPVPPLDGSKIIPYFLPERMQQSWYRFEQYGFVVLLILVFAFSGPLWSIISYPAGFITRLVYAGLP